MKTEPGKQKILAALQNAQVAGGAVSTLPAPTQAQKDEQQTNFYLLLLDNTSHFAAGGTALDNYRSHHQRALNTALAIGIANPVASVPLDDAYLSEAFGQHFLTDMFSGGHVRTPRGQITEYYVGTFAPRVINSMILNLRQRLEDGIYRQASDQSLKAWFFEGMAREKIRAALDTMIDQNIAKLKGGQQELTDYLGKALAGVVSGAIHDAEGKRGVVVTSQAHPTPWTAMGDDRLEQNDTINKEQAEAAVLAGLADVNRALTIGQREGALKAKIPTPTTLPSRVFFRFNSDALPDSALTPLDQAAAFLAYRPDTHLDVQGHTDPIGTDADNEVLGLARAQAVFTRINTHGVDMSQIDVSSVGENQLVTTDPHQYARDRRVELIWTSQPAPVIASGVVQTDETIALDRARQALVAEIGPPFTAVEQYIPEDVPDANPQLPEWHWDTMSEDLKTQIKDWVSRRFTADLQTKLLGSDMLAKRKVEDIDVDPRPIVEDMLKEISADPTGFLNGLFSPYLGPPDFSPD